MSEHSPCRIQRRRTKGWRKPPNSIIVSRPTLYANPWSGPDAVLAHRRFILQVLSGVVCIEVVEGTLDVEQVFPKPIEQWQRLRSLLVPAKRSPLRGMDLICFCPVDKPCHSDFLLKVVNR